MPLYVADYLADTGHLSAAEHGAYLMLIMHYWRQGSLPNDDGMLQRIARMTGREWARSRATIAAFFDAEWKHARVESELRKAQLKSAARADSGRRGGDAKALKTKNLSLANAKILLEQNLANGVASSSQPQSDKKERPTVSSTNGQNGHSLDASGVIIELQTKAKKEAAENDELVDWFFSQWQGIAKQFSLACPRAVTAPRRSHILARARELVAIFDFPDARSGFIDLLAKIRNSPLLTGQVGPRFWKCDLDWVTTESHFVAIMEGKYAKTEKPGQFEFGARR
jgi:uncharacterized protein YdaU (DUF1376 family)